MAIAPDAAQTPRTAQPTDAQPDPRRWISLAVVLVASFMVLLDVSIVNVAIPSVQRSLDTTFSQIQWVLAGYQLSYGVLLITGGRLGDIFGRKRLFIIGVAGFTLASALCGLSPSGNVLIGMRVVQGLMAALMYPQVFAIIQVMFPPRERAAAFGAAGAVIGVASISGPLLGGLLLKLDILGGWRPIFLVNVPIGIGAIVAAVMVLHESRAPNAPKVDWGGVVLVTAALFLVLYPLVEGREAGWPWWTWAMLAGSALVFAVFAVYVRIRARGTGSPLVEPELFQNRAFVVGLFITAAFLSGIPAFFLTFSLYLQIGEGFTPLAAGLTTMPFAIGSAIASGVSIRLVPKLGKNLLSIGMAVLVLGMVLVYLTSRALGTDVTGWKFIPALVVSGIGLGLTVAPLLNIILSGIHGRAAGSASGVLTTVQQVGGALGVAIIGVIFFGALGNNAGDAAGRQLPGLQQQLSSAHLPGPAVQAATGQFTQCFVDRSRESDPSVVPPSCPAQSASAAADPNTCPAPSANPTGAAFCTAAVTARQDNFSQAMQRSLYYNMGAWTLTFLLVFLLPKPDLQQAHRGAGTGH